MDLIKLFLQDNALYYIYEKQMCISDTQENLWIQYPWSQDEIVEKVYVINQVYYFYTNNNVYMLEHLKMINERSVEEGYKYFFTLLQLDDNTKIKICVNELGMVSLITEDDIIILESYIDNPIVQVFGFYLVITSSQESRTLILNILQNLHNLQQAQFEILEYTSLHGCWWNEQLFLLINQAENSIGVINFSSRQSIMHVQLPANQYNDTIINSYFLNDGSLFVQTDSMLLVYQNDLMQDPVQISPKQLHINTLDSQYTYLFKTLINEQPVYFIVRQTEASVVYFEDKLQITTNIPQPFFYINDKNLSRTEVNIAKPGFPSYNVKQQGKFKQLTSTDVRLVSYYTTLFDPLLDQAKDELQLYDSYDFKSKITKLIFYIIQNSDEQDQNSVSRFKYWLYHIKQINNNIMLSELTFIQIMILPNAMSMFAIVQQNGQYEQLLFLGLYEIQHANILCDLQTNSNNILSVIELEQGKFQITLKNTEVYDIIYSIQDGSFMKTNYEEGILYKNYILNEINQQYPIIMQAKTQKQGNIYELHVIIQTEEIQQSYKLYESKEDLYDVYAMYYDRVMEQFIYLIKVKDEVKLCVYKIRKAETLTLNYKWSDKTQIMQYSESYFIIFNNNNIDYLYDGQISNLFESSPYMSVKDVVIIPGIEVKQDGRIITLIRTLLEIEGTSQIYDFILQREPLLNRLNKYKTEKLFQQYDHIFAKINTNVDAYGMKQVKIYITCPSEYYLCIEIYNQNFYKTQKVVERDIIPLQEDEKKLIFKLNQNNHEQLLFSYCSRDYHHQQANKQIQVPTKQQELQYNVIYILKVGKNNVSVLNIYLDYFVFITEREAFKKQWKALKNNILHSRYHQLIEQETHFQIENEILGAVLIQNVLYCFEKISGNQPVFEMAVYKIDIVSKRPKLLCTKRENMNNFLSVAIGNKSGGEINKIQFKKCYYEKVKDSNRMQRYNIICEYLYQHKIIVAKQDYMYNAIDYSMLG